MTDRETSLSATTPAKVLVMEVNWMNMHFSLSPWERVGVRGFGFRDPSKIKAPLTLALSRRERGQEGHFPSHLSQFFANSFAFALVTSVSGSKIFGLGGSWFLTILSSRISTDLWPQP